MLGGRSPPSGTSGNGFKNLLFVERLSRDRHSRVDKGPGTHFLPTSWGVTLEGQQGGVVNCSRELAIPRGVALPQILSRTVSLVSTLDF